MVTATSTLDLVLAGPRVIGRNGAGKSTLLSLLAGDLPATPARPRRRPAGTRIESDSAGPRQAVLPQQAERCPSLHRRTSSNGPRAWAGSDLEDVGRPRWRDASGRPSWNVASPAISDLVRGAAGPGLVRPNPRRRRRACSSTNPPPRWTYTVEQLMPPRGRVGRERPSSPDRSHDVGLAAYADEVAVLHEGQLVARGEPTAVLTEALLEAVYRVPVDVFPHPGHGGLVITPRLFSPKDRNMKPFVRPTRPSGPTAPPRRLLCAIAALSIAGTTVALGATPASAAGASVSISPATGSISGATTLTLSGSGFQSVQGASAASTSSSAKSTAPGSRAKGAAAVSPTSTCPTTRPRRTTDTRSSSRSPKVRRTPRSAANGGTHRRERHLEHDARRPRPGDHSGDGSGGTTQSTAEPRPAASSPSARTASRTPPTRRSPR